MSRKTIIIIRLQKFTIIKRRMTTLRRSGTSSWRRSFLCFSNAIYERGINIFLLHSNSCWASFKKRGNALSFFVIFVSLYTWKLGTAFLKIHSYFRGSCVVTYFKVCKTVHIILNCITPWISSWWYAFVKKCCQMKQNSFERKNSI